MLLNDQPIPLRAGAAFWLGPGDALDATHDPRNPLEVCAFHFHLARPGSPANVLGKADLPLPENPRRITDLDALTWHAHQAARYADLPGPIAAARCRTAAWQLLLLFLDPLSTDPGGTGAGERLDDIAQRIRARPAAFQTVREMARDAAMSRSHFSRQFAERFGIPPLQFLIRARIDRAQILLKETRMTLEQIAEATGYQDVFYFSKQFKTTTGTPPAKWRREKSRRH